MVVLNGKKCAKAVTALGLGTMLLFSSTAMAAYPLLKTGSRGDKVSDLQQQLKGLGFYHYARITGYYGSITKGAVISFQRSKGLTADGIAGPRTFAVLEGTSSGTTSRGGSTARSSLLKRGMKGSAVRELQQKLKSKGFYRSSVDGIFGPITQKAVKSFQRSVSIHVDGIVGPVTNARLNKSTSSRGSSSSERPSSATYKGMIAWSQADKLFPRGAKARVTDVDTGKSFMAYRMGGHLHADVEPLTASDTSIMKSIYGGKWSWARRAIIVEINGNKIAASMNGMPHGSQTIHNNGFAGQFCIHFLGSRTHGTNHVDSDHQAMVRKAAASIQ